MRISLFMALYMSALPLATAMAQPAITRAVEQNSQGQPNSINGYTDMTPKAVPGMVHSGTGFFVSNSGYIITNEHVVRGCKSVNIRGSVTPTTATVQDVDVEYDLALIKANVRPNRTASLRSTQASLRINDPVMVIGYPLNHGITGKYKVVNSSVIGLKGPQDEPNWIRFSSAAMQGNSGGPLMDASGNVVGVIQGKTKLVRKHPKTGKTLSVQEADVAISLPVLKRFLHKNSVYFKSNDSQGYYSIDRVENIAKSFIVNIHCQG